MNTICLHKLSLLTNTYTNVIYKLKFNVIVIMRFRVLKE